MLSLRRLAVVSSCLLTLVASASVGGATTTSSTATSCAFFVTSTAKFDDLATGSPVPNAYGNAGWYGFTVANLTDINTEGYVALYPASPYNAIQMGYQTYTGIESSYSSPNGGLYPSQLQSFYFGCIVGTNYGIEADPCTVMVIATVWGYWESEIVRKSYTWSFPAGGKKSKLQKVTPAIAGTDFQFVVTQGSSGAILFLDDVVILHANASCVD